MIDLAQYRCNIDKNKVRLHKEDEKYSDPFASDRDKIIRSNSFKRLQDKTQVFFNYSKFDVNDHWRNRMTHSIEVSSISRLIASALGVSSELTEVISLSHDLGHPPFGHSGEDVLNKCAEAYCEFNHNIHTLRLVFFLEHKYINFDGLNLTRGVIDGLVKHNGPVASTSRLPSDIFEYIDRLGIEIAKYPNIEAQISGLADDIAYVCHDIEDAINMKIICLEELEEIDLIHDYINDIAKISKKSDDRRLIYEVVRKMVFYFINSLVVQTKNNIVKYNIKIEEEVINLGRCLVEFEKHVFDEIVFIKKFLFDKVYNNKQIASSRLQCQQIINDLFNVYISDTNLLPACWNMLIGNESDKISVVINYIAGMTDRFVIEQHYKLFGEKHSL